MTVSRKKVQPFSFKKKPFCCIVVTALATLPVFSHAATYKGDYLAISTGPMWHPRGTLNLQAGTYESVQLDYLYPFLGREDSLFFLDGRYQWTSRESNEENLGLGHRQLMSDNKYILGESIWVDHLDHNGRDFNNITVGGEWLTNVYDLRANVYIPFGDKSHQTGYSQSPYITGHTVGVFRTNRVEEAVPGFDIEAGAGIPMFPKTKVYGAYYHFGFDNDPDMNGGRIRGEYYYSYNTVFTASYAYDNIRHSVGFAGVRLSFGGANQVPGMLLRNRMEDYVIRDVDIITIHHNQKPFLIQDPRSYWYVNNTSPAGGDGTFEHPFQAENTAESASANNDVIYTFQGSGFYPLPTGGLMLKPGQFFTGSGGDLIFMNTVIIPGTTPPILNGRLNVASGNTLSNFTLSGQGSSETTGIYGNKVSNVSAWSLTVQDFSSPDANGTSYSGSGTVDGNRAGNARSVYGIRIIDSVNTNLTNVTVNHIQGGSANGGDATSTGSSSSYAYAGYGGDSGRATGIDLRHGSSVLNNVTVTNIISGDANGGNATAVTTNARARSHGGYGGRAGSAFGLYLTNADTSLTNVLVTDINGGSSHGGDASSSGGTFYNHAFGNSAEGTGQAVGIYITTSNASLLNVNVARVNTGTAIGGDATATGGGSSNQIATSGYGGYNDYTYAATGINLYRSNVKLSNVMVTDVLTGTANDGASTASGNTTGSNHAYTESGSHGLRLATGINLTQANANLSNVTVNNISGGSANGGDTTASGTGAANIAVSEYAGTGGSATGINLHSGIITLSNVNIFNIQGGSGNGGNSSASGGASNSATGGNGHLGGNAIGLNQVATTIVSSSNLNITGVSGGSANGGAPNGTNGTPGTSQNTNP